ncbi:hypothetical protein J4421_06330 [Candidatus Woesearchaeota archaeon]|nr:hypothetical protein [Candidatus Woesearchaeota archaeon]
MLKPQKFVGVVVENKLLAPDVLKLSLKVPLSFGFTAGQFVTIKVNNGKESRMKSYSILNPPSQPGKLDFCIKILPDGFASDIFKAAKEGDSFDITGPLGHFFFDEETLHEHWFICAGTGITPLYSMLQEYVPRSPGKKFRLLFGARTQDHLLFYEEFRKMEKRYPYFTYFPILSRENWEGKMGHAQDHLGKDLQNKTFYICGLKDLVLETKELLLNKGVDSKNIKFERYN